MPFKNCAALLRVAGRGFLICFCTNRSAGAGCRSNGKIEPRVKQVGARFGEEAQRLGAAVLDAGFSGVQSRDDFFQQRGVLYHLAGELLRV
jgi:hypothetical protein